jgi:hypothetical protein
MLLAAKALDLMTGELVDVPTPFLCIAGFECDSVSMANNSRPKYHDCLAARTGATGHTWGCVSNFVAKHKPTVLVLENVRGLSLSFTSSMGCATPQAVKKETNLSMCARTSGFPPIIWQHCRASLPIAGPLLLQHVLLD